MSTFKRIIGSNRFWAAFIGLLTIVAVQVGVPQEKANALSAAILGVVTMLIGSYTVRGVEQLLQSTRFWTAIIGLATIVAVQVGVPQEKANALSAAVLGVITVLLGSFTVRGVSDGSTSASSSTIAEPDSIGLVPIQ